MADILQKKFHLPFNCWHSLAHHVVRIVVPALSSQIMPDGKQIFTASFHFGAQGESRAKWP
jgi:hypothetical protein